MSVQPFAVFGHPIRHSLSPRIHQAFAAQFDIALDYQTIDATPEEFPAAVQRFFADGGRGANVTLPHKAAAFALATEHTPAARRAGTANVLTPLPNGGLAAHNTDGIGMLRDMTVRQGMDLRGRQVLLLGAGGAARGVAWNLLDAGIATLVIANRSPDAANTLAAAIDDPARVHTCHWEALAGAAPHDLIVNATSAGVLGGSLQLPTTLLRDGASCYDLSYGDAADSFLAWARNAGARRGADGLGMLLETAADAFELWHGRLPDTEPVYRMLRPS
jgi:shikimate dehydrogenase